ncbi:DUF1648 domain-containing protein [Paenibacillus radicis (ex Xue et al. 2023)]|uniref:DUF1648 domain-containing protein n=1 Tax=Paenibacillus radicis (ex Xue et al. 2023) TaxID=2972489 RepID=A0ABT1YM97_9BACL|nr:DUF1648 domain-containing protein [Paenibacillus radicis (ex Xue et al. 2023)]MCR8634298.1 DUF1648 domain-containing protein [Paenibacillus radicis (ex Xue et al. 2023)]
MKRPILSIPKTNLEVLHDVISIVVILSSIAYLFVEWPKLPAQIPTHFNGSGKVDGWGGKGTLFILPIISIVIYIGLTVLSKFPHSFNYLSEITESNAQRQYINAKMLLSWLKVEIAVLFSYLLWKSVEVAADKINDLGLFIYVILAIVVLTIIFSIYRTIKLK